jgi:transposase-like protein
VGHFVLELGEVKEEILGKVKAGERVVKLAEQYGVSEKTIYYWLRTKTHEPVSMIAYNKIKRENEELKAIIGALSVQLERIKKKTR